ncbi:MAG: CoA transferase [Gammaproteobacteria bacterium]|nr:CoA transferase [Gammaproteobacteria bacterium]
MSAPLEDIKVLEVDNYMAAPSAAAILADMGADVLKIEPITGDPMRGLSRPLRVESNFAEYDLQFDVDNRGKRSAAIALDKPKGQALVQRLAQDADVFLCNLLAQRQQRFGLNPETLFAANPRLVHATLTGYGTTGPDAWRPGYDVTAFFGRSGLSDAMREGVDGVVPRAGVAQGDHTTGLALVAAILAALRLAERTGEGQVLETSLYETAVWTQASELTVTATDKAPVRRRARHEALTPMTNRYPCGDGKWVVLNMLDSGAWERLCRAIGREDWLADERYVTGRDRYRRMPELVDGIDATLSAKARDEWGAVFDEHGVIWGPVLGLHEVVDDPHADAIGLFPELQHPELGTYRTVNAPMRFQSADVRPRGPAPTVGEHTEQILREAGLSQPEIQALFDDGIVK